ncbi:MAG: response regulator [Pseudorhizobium sp.]
MTAADDSDPVLGAAPARRVLLVEDEVLIRMDIAETLRDNGWEVIEASTADDAIEVLQRDVNFRLLLTDVHMPGTKDGLHLARLAKCYPHIKVAVMSGGYFPSQDDEKSFDIFLPKPVVDVMDELSNLAISSHDETTDP